MRAASTADQPAAETFFAVRHRPDPRRLASSSVVGAAFTSGGPYVADKGFGGEENHSRRWLAIALRGAARSSHPPAPKRNSRRASEALARALEEMGGIPVR